MSFSTRSWCFYIIVLNVFQHKKLMFLYYSSKCLSAQEAGVFKAEIAPITVKGRKGKLK